MYCMYIEIGVCKLSCQLTCKDNKHRHDLDDIQNYYDASYILSFLLYDEFFFSYVFCYSI